MQYTTFRQMRKLIHKSYLRIKYFLYGIKKKTHKKVNETQHCTTKLMLESHNFIMCDAEMLNK